VIKVSNKFSVAAGHVAADPGQNERFKIEAQAPAGLNHPSIAAIFTIKEFIEDIFYILIFASRLPYCRFNLALLFAGHDEKRCSF